MSDSFTVVAAHRSLYRFTPCCKETQEQFDQRHHTFSLASDFPDVPCQQPGYPDMTSYKPQTSFTATQKSESGMSNTDSDFDTWNNHVQPCRTFIEVDCSEVATLIAAGQIITSLTIKMTGTTEGFLGGTSAFYLIDGNSGLLPSLADLPAPSNQRSAVVDAFWRAAVRWTEDDDNSLTPPPPQFPMCANPLPAGYPLFVNPVEWDAVVVMTDDMKAIILAGGVLKFIIFNQFDVSGTIPLPNPVPANTRQDVLRLEHIGSIDATVSWDAAPPEPPVPPIPTGPIDKTLYLDWTGSAPSQSHNWCPNWTTPATSMALSRRSDGSLAVLFGTCDGTGRILRLDESLHNDDGQAIESFYQTAFGGGPSGRNSFQYLTSSAKGAGQLDMTAIKPDGVTEVGLKSRGLEDEPLGDQEWSGLRVNGERIAWRFGTNAVDAWFKMRKLVAYVVPSAWSRTRGR